MLYPNMSHETLTSIGQTSKHIDIISYNLTYNLALRVNSTPAAGIRNYYFFFKEEKYTT